MIRLPKGAALPVTLKVLEYELFHICPLMVSHLLPSGARIFFFLFFTLSFLC